MNKLPMIRLAGAAFLALAAIGASAAAAAQWTAAQRAGRRARERGTTSSTATWIADGRDDAPRKVYVFMDANCKYCTKFWSDARPWVDSGKVQLRHVMVAVIAPTSAGKAAAHADRSGSGQAPVLVRAGARVRRGAHDGRTGRVHSLEDPNLKPLEVIPAKVARQLETTTAAWMRSLGMQRHAGHRLPLVERHRRGQAGPDAGRDAADPGRAVTRLRAFSDAFGNGRGPDRGGRARIAACPQAASPSTST